MTNQNPSPEHIARVKRELQAAGATKWGMLKLESRYLPKILHDGESIGGMVYGRYGKGSAMLIATDRRVVFLDRSPGYTIADELTYDVVSGISLNSRWPYAGVTLHTRLGDFGLTFVNIKAAERFVRFIEDRRLEQVDHIVNTPLQASSKPKTAQATLNEEMITFLKEHEIATFSTVDRDDTVHGAVVYYVVGEENNIYIMTKSETQKAHDIFGNKQVALTIFDSYELQTMQLEGEAEVEANQKIKNIVFSEIVRPRLSKKGQQLPPVTQLKEGSFMIIRITPKNVKFRDYSANA